MNQFECEIIRAHACGRGAMWRNGGHCVKEESKISRNGRNHTHFHYSLAHLYWSCMISIPFRLCSNHHCHRRLCRRRRLLSSSFSHSISFGKSTDHSSYGDVMWTTEHEHVWITMCSIFSQILGHCYWASALNIIFICSLLEWIGCLTALSHACLSHSPHGVCAL